MADSEKFLHPGEVAELFGVDTKTIARWADAGKLKSVRTAGGHRRYRRLDVEELQLQLTVPTTESKRET